MKSMERKIAIIEVSNAKEKLSLAQAAHDVEVKALKECEDALHAAFHSKVPMDKFLQLRDVKRIQGRVVRESFRTVVEAMNVLDDAETRYDVLFFTMEAMR